MTPTELIETFADVAAKLPPARKYMRSVYADAIAARERGAAATMAAIQADEPVIRGAHAPVAKLNAITMAHQEEVEQNQYWIEEKKRVFEVVHDLEEIRKNAEKIAIEMVERNGASNGTSGHERSGSNSEGVSEGTAGDGEGAEDIGEPALQV